MSSSPSVWENDVKRFNAFAKTILRNELKNWLRDNKSRLQNEVSFSEFDEHVIEELCVYELDDEPDFMCKQLKVLEFNVHISNGLLFQALNTLSEVKRNIILMYFWLDMKDAEIADKLGIKRRSVNYQKHCAYEKIKNYLEENDYEE